MLKIKDIMNTQIQKIPAEATVFEAIEKMIDNRIRSLLIIPCKNTKCGVITVRDIIFKVIAKKKDPRKIKVEEIASTPIITVSKEAHLGEVITLMETNNIARVFVEDKGEIIGVVAFFDILTNELIKLAKEL